MINCCLDRILLLMIKILGHIFGYFIKLRLGDRSLDSVITMDNSHTIFSLYHTSNCPITCSAQFRFIPSILLNALACRPSTFFTTSRTNCMLVQFFALSSAHYDDLTHVTTLLGIDIATRHSKGPK